MPIISRWWGKNRLQILLTIFSVALALIIFYSKGEIILETYASFAHQLQPYSEDERKVILTNALFEELQNKISDLSAQNKQLKKLLKYQEGTKSNFITAPVIGRSPDSWWQIMTIGAGSNQGVKKDNVVTGIGGLVGRIIDVTPNTSKVLLVTDSSSRVGAIINRTRYMGFIRGNSTSTAVMVFYAKVSDVKIGDMVTVSAVSSIFPSGIPIGKVVSIDLNKSPAPEATIQFTAPMDFLEIVTIQDNFLN